MGVKKFYSNKAKPGWKDNSGYVPKDKISNGEQQKDEQKKYYSWGYDIDLDPENYDASGKPLRNRRRESGFDSQSTAKTAAARVKYSEKSDKYDKKKYVLPTLAEVLQAYLDRLTSKRERRRAKTIFNRWLEVLKTNVRLDDLKLWHLKKYIQERRGKVSDVSINREFSNIGSALHGAYLDFPILEDWNCPKIPRLKTEKSRRERLISAGEIGKLFAAFFERERKDESAADYRKRRTAGHAFQMAALTGARIGEIAAMRWDHIDWDAGIIQIHGRKTRFVSASTIRYLELTPTMRSVLSQRRELNEFGELVFCRTGNSITHYYDILETVAKRAGLNYGKKKRGAFVTHDARHTAITKMLQGGIDLSTVGSITGHSDKTLILHYSHATRESKKVAGKVLDDFINPHSVLEDDTLIENDDEDINLDLDGLDLD